jgi:hypothetical protein
MHVPSRRWMGCGVSISNPSSGGVIRARLVASAKNANTMSRGSGRHIEGWNVWIRGIRILVDGADRLTRRYTKWSIMAGAIIHQSQE